MIWWTSDMHLGHERILEFGRDEAFSTLQEHDEMLIHNWNSVVQPDDTVWHLGDFVMGKRKQDPASTVRRLNGKINFILGNHDLERQLLDLVTQFPGKVSYYGEMLTLPKEHIVLCHYPIEIWQAKNRKWQHYHGHSHSNCNTQPNAKRLDVGVDSARKILGSHRPFSHDEIKAIMSKRLDLSASDHHS